jgi:hypothetical protein
MSKYQIITIAETDFHPWLYDVCVFRSANPFRHSLDSAY